LDWSNKKILVTGAGGFIGSHLAEQIVLKGGSVRALVHYNAMGRWGWLDTSDYLSEIEVIPGDITDKDSFSKALDGIDIVFHLAALIGIPYSYRAPRSYVDTNVIGTLNVLQSALDQNIDLVVHTSTSETYGSAQYIPIDEEHPLLGQSPYSASKIGADKLAESFNRSFNLPVVTVRPFNTYGPRQSARAVIPTIVTQVLTQGWVNLGNLHPTRDLNYVIDTTRGFMSAAEHPEAVGEVINLGTGHEISIGELARMIFRLMGKEEEIRADTDRARPQASEVDRLCADITKAREILDWSPSYSLEDGLLETIDWIQNHLQYYKPSLYNI
jgi:NAD dependent epimerase/dehydratase